MLAFKKLSPVSTVSTGFGVPLIIVGVYNPPLEETKIYRHHPLKEHPYGSKDYDFDYPIGARLWSNVTEYTISSDTIPYRIGNCGFKYFHEMKENFHTDARFGKRHFITIDDENRIVILRQLFATWYVCIYATLE